jgi:hypothetical protein
VLGAATLELEVPAMGFANVTVTVGGLPVPPPASARDPYWLEFAQASGSPGPIDLAAIDCVMDGLRSGVYVMRARMTDAVDVDGAPLGLLSAELAVTVEPGAVAIVTSSLARRLPASIICRRCGRRVDNGRTCGRPARCRQVSRSMRRRALGHANLAFVDGRDSDRDRPGRALGIGRSAVGRSPSTARNHDERVGGRRAGPQLPPGADRDGRQVARALGDRRSPRQACRCRDRW